jgi:3-methyladenine DNA glycosylase/8-oxoguanine DNA glycosylase
MRKTNISLPVPAPFDLEATLLGHGWASLLPNVFDGESGEFRRVERLASGRVVRWRVPLKLANSKNALAVRVESTSGLTRRENDDLTRRLRHLLRLDEDFSGFYSMCARKGSPWDALCAGGGRLIRAPEIFEDLVKVILTTNIQWGGTKRMVAEIIQAYGASFPGDPALRAFPAPADIANDTLEAFKSSVNLGYRAEYIHELALRFSKGELAADDFLDADLPTPDLRKQLLSIKGVGIIFRAGSMTRQKR